MNLNEEMTCKDLTNKFFFRKIFTGSLSGSEPEIHRFIKSIEDIGVWSFRYLLVVHFEKWVCPIDDAMVQEKTPELTSKLISDNVSF